MIKISNMAGDFQVASMSLGPIYTNSHIIYQKQGETGKALIIDAPMDSMSAISHFLTQQNITAHALLLTHGHWDHMGGAEILRKEYGLPVWGSVHDNLLFQNPQIMSAFAGNVKLLPVVIDLALDVDFCSGKKSLYLTLENWPELDIQALAMPGHTPGGIAFYFPQAGCVMSGDQLFQGSVGRSDFPGGNFELLSASIHHSLYTLPTETTVFSGHGEPTTIHHEMQHNPFVNVRDSHRMSPF